MVFFVLPQPIFGQTSLSQFEDARLYTQEDGLPSEEVYKVIEDQQGFIWLATKAGISRFDGNQFTNFAHFYTEGEWQEMGAILDLKIDSSLNRLWASGDQGIFTSPIQDIKFQRLEEAYGFEESIGDRVENMLLEGHQIIWTTNYMTGLSRVDLESKTIRNFRFDHPEVKSRAALNQLTPIVQDTDPNYFWLGTEGGFIHFNYNTFDYQVHFFDQDPEASENSISYLYVDDKKVFLGTETEGLITYDKHRETYEVISPKSKERSFNHTLDLYSDDGKILWCTTDRQLLKVDLVADSVIFQIPHNLAEGKLRGVSRIDSRGIVWFWSQHGLFRYDPMKSRVPFIQLQKPVLLQHPMVVREILYSGEYAYVLGLRSEGLYKINLQDRSFSTLSFGRHHDINLRDMVEMEDGRLLILSFDNIFIVDPETDKIILSPLQIEHPHPTFQTVAKDRQNRYWIGTNSNGLYCLDFTQEIVRNYREEFDVHRSENHRWIRNVYVDTQNNLWIAKGSNTVLDLSADTMRCLDPADTTVLKYYVVNEFVEDIQGRIWMSSASQGIGFTTDKGFYQGLNHRIDGEFQGIYPFTDSSLLTLAEGLGILHLDDLTHNPINLGYDLSGFHPRGPIVGDGKGEYLIGCENGVIMYNPSIPQNYSEIPIPYVKEIHANGINVFNGEDLSKRIFQFDQQTTHLTVSLSTLGFQHSNRYFLYKSQKEWLSIEGDNITFTDLRPGDLSFEIKACNGSGECSSEAVTYVFHIVPAWYQTSWAYSLFFILIAIILYSFYLYRINRRLEQQEVLRLTELDEFKSRFYQNITHEFRTPLTVINGMTEELIQGPQEESATKLNLIKRNSNNLLRLINQLLDLSKLQAGMMKSAVVQTDVISFVRYLTLSHESLANQRDISLTFSSASDSILMDLEPDQLQPVLTNLISNAIKFTAESGKVDVSVALDDPRPHPSIKISVQDNGVGIPTDEIPYIFDRFHQSESTSSYAGTGIGLALVKELAELMEGEIEVSSKEGQGSTFVLTLPVRNQAALIQTANSPISTPIQPVSDIVDQSNSNDSELPLLLIIEDNSDIVFYLKSCLEDQYQFITAHNGQEGIEKALRSVPDIIISDVMMPLKDGFEVCTTLKEDERTSHIPIILLTAKASAEDKRSGLQQGADAYLIKPFDKAELMIRMENLRTIRKTLQEKYSGKLFYLGQNNPSPKTKEDIFLAKVEKIVLDNIENELFSHEDLAEAMHLSLSQVHRKIKALSGSSTSIYIRLLRLEKAKEYLRSDDLSISEIAYLVGFKSPVYFSQIFKQTFGKSPSESRE